MTEMDALRLRVAVRAYRATKPSELEVERGVRKTLSAMRRSQIRRRKSLTPAIIVAILAFGTLAYANPNNVRRWMSTLLGSARETVSERAALVKAAPPRAAEPRQAEAPASMVPPAVAAVAPGAAASTAAPPAVERASSHKPSRPAARPSAATWAEVNDALAGQDTPRALAALADLSKHGDAATRAKAELGIAQLLWARGDRATACALGKTLLARKNAPQRVQERARTLLEGCSK